MAFPIESVVGPTPIVLQKAPYPFALERVVESITYKQGFLFKLFLNDRQDGSWGLTLEIKCFTPDSYDEKNTRGTRHWFIVPAATYDERAWRRWVFDRVVDVETHEAAEFFKCNGVRPYAPNHGQGRDPYTIVERGTDADAKKRPGE